MIQLIGVKSHCDINIRQNFAIVSAKLESKLKIIRENIGSVVIISTCNRTEIYVDSRFQGEQLIQKVFESLAWDKELLQYIFYVKEETAVRHLMEVICGFHSKIVGEDQILGQIKLAYEVALKNKTVKGNLQRLFQSAITCSKKFKYSCEIYKIPVSSASIVARETMQRGITSIMLIGFGETGSLILKYLTSGSFNNIYVVVRDVSKIDNKESYPKGVKFISFDEKNHYINKVDCIISCTSAPHTVVKKEEVPLKKMLIYDLALPRDVDIEVSEMGNVEIYNIDDISIIDEENKVMRLEKMKKYKCIIKDSMEKFLKWKSLRDLSPQIQKLQRFGEEVNKERIKTFEK